VCECVFKRAHRLTLGSLVSVCLCSPGTVAVEETLQHTPQRIPLSDQKSAESEYNVYEDVSKLRSLLSSAATELSRQILSAAPKRGADMDESFQLSLAQKKLAYLESKLGLAECEARESKRKALEALGRSAELEETTSELESRIESLQKEGTRAQQLLAAGIPTSRGKVNEEESIRSIAQVCSDVVRAFYRVKGFFDFVCLLRAWS
jgi:hypothetical protein